MHVIFVLAITCGRAPEIRNAQANLSVLYPGQSLKYTCTDPEHRFLDGYKSKFIYCNKHGEFKAINSNCQGNLLLSPVFAMLRNTYHAKQSAGFERKLMCSLSWQVYNCLLFSQSLSTAGITWSCQQIKQQYIGWRCRSSKTCSRLYPDTWRHSSLHILPGHWPGLEWHTSFRYW